MNRELDPSWTTVVAGLCSYPEVRRIQGDLVKKRIAGECGDTVILCEHPPTLSLGRRTREGDLGQRSAEEWARQGVQIVHANRGGAVTYHGPGQLIIYPVCLLRARRAGVRRFVEVWLGAIANCLREIGINADAGLNPPGVWVAGGEAGNEERPRMRKIGACGLYIEHGVTDHGFSVNWNCELEVFSQFIPCAMPELKVTSAYAELKRVGASCDSSCLEFGHRVVLSAARGLMS